MPSVSIIVPAYSVSQYIAETIESILAQTFQDFEIIVINDGCPDTINMERALKPYMARIHYIRQANTGLAGARNAGIAVAQGEYLAFIDSDDQWLPDYLASQLAFLREHPEVDVVYADAELFGEGELVGKRFMEVSPSDGKVTIASLLAEQCCVMVSVLARREAIERAGNFDAGLRSIEGVSDFDLWLRVLQTGGKIAYQRRVLIRYRKRSDSLSANTQRMLDSRFCVLDKLDRSGDLTMADRAASAEARRRWSAMAQLEAGKQLVLAGDYHAARKALTDASTYFHSPKIRAFILLLRTAPPVARWILGSRGF